MTLVWHDWLATTNGDVVFTPGRWRLFCAIRGHESMTATVTASG